MSEHVFQAWCDRFLDRVVLPPMFTTAIDVAARDMASIGRIAKLQARGAKFGLPDLVVAQHGNAAWLELKRGTPVSARQEATHNAMRVAGMHVSVCSTMQEVLRALRHFAFELHPNADALADEYEMRVVAREVAPKTPRSPKLTRKRATMTQIATAHRIGVWKP